MIQLRVFRLPYRGAPEGSEIFKRLTKNITVGTLAELFGRAEDILESIPESERYNVHYTVGSTEGGDRQVWLSQEVIPFDIDHVVDEDGNSDNEKLIEVICASLRVDPEKCVVVKTGNGMQILVQPHYPILQSTFFAQNKRLYDDLCSRIDNDLKAAGLKGECDRAVFAPNHTMRFPLTENRKHGKPTRNALLLRKKLVPQDFEITPPAPGLKAALKPWETKKGEALPVAVVNSFKIDSDSVEKGCEFLKASKEDPQSMNESQWYAMLTIVSRLENGREKAHEYSQPDTRYKRDETERKIEHALASHGPRTCKNIESLWEGCISCPNYGKVNSPVSLKTSEFIATETTGFHVLSEKGGLRPQVSDLRKFFEREHPYRVHAQSGAVFVYEGGMYRQWSVHELRAYAQKHFFPEVSSAVIQEFTQSVGRVNLVDSDWFTASTRNKINFHNGVYDLTQKTLLPHNHRWGFLHKLPFDYDKDAVSPNFDRFMEAITCGDKEIEKILLEFVGYAICDRDYWMQKALILIGEGSNGKSTFFEVVESLVGTANTSYLNFEALKSETSLSHLQGKILNIGDELPSYTIKSTDFFKKLFGGRVLTRKLYQDSIVIKNSAKFFFSGNELPRAEDITEGFLRRLVIVPFLADFKIGKNADTKVLEKIRPELPGIFNAVMAAYQEMEARKDFTRSAAVEKMLNEYRRNIDDVGAWFLDSITILDEYTSKDYTTLPNLYDRYVGECTRTNSKVVNRATFVKRISKLIPGWEQRHVRSRVGGERTYLIHGVRFSSEADDIREASVNHSY